MKNNLTRKIAFSGLFLALALIVSLIENLIPPLVPALPYAKLGLGNVVLLACFLLVGVWEGCTVLVLKCFFAALFAGNLSMLIWSLPSACAAYIVMVLLARTRAFSVTGLSVAGGMIHNTVQIAVSVGVVGSSVVAYLPYMILAGGIAGLVTGLVCHFVVSFARRNSLGTMHDEVYVRLPKRLLADDDEEIPYAAYAERASESDKEKECDSNAEGDKD